MTLDHEQGTLSLGGPQVADIPHNRRWDDPKPCHRMPYSPSDQTANPDVKATPFRPEPANVPGTNPKDRLGAAKPSITKIPPAALIYMALAMQDGAKKYGPFNWRENKVIASIYIDACMRHLLAFLDGEECAPDSGRPHLAHALASLAIIVDAKETGNLIDDRPVPGAAPKLIDFYTVKS